MACVELTGITKRFGDTTVLGDLSLRIEDGEFMVFLGPSGCGKSTLLRIIAGLEAADEGEVWIGGKRVDQLPPGARDVAMVFQHYALYPHMSVRENLAFGLRNAKVDEAEIRERIEAAATMLEIAPFLDRRPTQLSGGQRQRVAIGRAIVKQPSLFLFDEPLSNLDASLRARTRVELAQLHHRMKSTMIFVTHDQIEAMTLADRIVLMSTRGIEQVGRPLDIYMRPATEFVACFVGSPKINLLPTELSKGRDGRARAKLPGGTVIATGIETAKLPTRGAFRLGVRAEEIDVVAPKEGQVQGTADVVERLGDKTLVHVLLDDGSPVVAADTGASLVRSGERIGLGFARARVHLFDADGRGYHSATGAADG